MSQATDNNPRYPGIYKALIAQLVEHYGVCLWVTGSSPVGGTLRSTRNECQNVSATTVMWEMWVL